MEEKIKRDDEIDLREYEDFLKRRKWCVIITTVACMAAGWIYALYAPTTYTISAIVKTPSVVSPQNFTRKINEGAFEGDAARILNETRAKARVIPDIRLIRMESDNLKENEVENHIKLFFKLFDEIHGQYQDKISAEKNMLSKRIISMRTRFDEEVKLAKLLKEIVEYNNKEVALALNLLYRKVLFIESIILEENVEMLEQRKDGIQNISFVSEPHIAEKKEPNFSQLIAVSSVIGVLLGIFIGYIKDVFSVSSGNL